jgi:hypothetical protein
MSEHKNYALRADKAFQSPAPQLSADERTCPGNSTGSVKDMPAYDPDAEIYSLALTIPSWVGSIDRVRSATHFDEISEAARCGLEAELDNLQTIVNSMISTLKEKNP